MPIPLYGFLEGDILGLIVLAEENDTVVDVARKLQDAASMRVTPRDHMEFVYEGKTINPDLTVTQAALQALDRFDVRRTKV